MISFAMRRSGEKAAQHFVVSSQNGNFCAVRRFSIVSVCRLDLERSCELQELNRRRASLSLIRVCYVGKSTPELNRRPMTHTSEHDYSFSSAQFRQPNPKHTVTCSSMPPPFATSCNLPSQHMTAFAVPGWCHQRAVSHTAAVRTLGTSHTSQISTAFPGVSKISVCRFVLSRSRPAPFPLRRVVTSRGPGTGYSKPKDEAARMSFTNRLLASRSITLSFVVICSLLYLVAICFVGLAVSRVSMQGHERVVLLGLGILLPDFRHVLKSYSEAVQQLQRYKPGFKGFRFVSKPNKEEQEDPLEGQYEDVPPEPFSWRKQPELVWLSGAMRQIQEKFESKTSKIDKLLADFSRDFTRPIVETSTQIKQLTTGTDLTLRKNVIAAAVSIFLSLAGYFVSAAGETSIGGVAIMLGSLVPNAVLAPRHHEMLTLIQDIRIAISLVGTLACAVSAFFPVCASYCVLLCCLSLVVSRLPVDWMLDW